MMPQLITPLMSIVARSVLLVVPFVAPVSLPTSVPSPVFADEGAKRRGDFHFRAGRGHCAVCRAGDVCDAEATRTDHGYRFSRAAAEGEGAERPAHGVTGVGG